MQKSLNQYHLQNTEWHFLNEKPDNAHLPREVLTSEQMQIQKGGKLNDWKRHCKCAHYDKEGKGNNDDNSQSPAYNRDDCITYMISRRDDNKKLIKSYIFYNHFPHNYNHNHNHTYYHNYNQSLHQSHNPRHSRYFSFSQCHYQCSYRFDHSKDLSLQLYIEVTIYTKKVDTTMLLPKTSVA